jgi:hypothetical protein
VHAPGVGAAPLFWQSRLTRRITRDVEAIDVERDEAGHTGDFPAVGALIGMNETGCWRILFNSCVGLLGKDALCKMMFVVVRHGQDFYCKAQV